MKSRKNTVEGLLELDLKQVRERIAKRREVQVEVENAKTDQGQEMKQNAPEMKTLTLKNLCARI